MNRSSETSEAVSLRGKTVAVFTRNRPATAPALLANCLLETRAGRLFLVGASMPAHPSSKEWSDGVRRAIAWDAVDEYFLFTSPDDYYARLQEAPGQTFDMPPNLPAVEFPQSAEGIPVEPSGIQLEPDASVEVGSTVLAFSQGRWWRAEVVELQDDDQVHIHFPGWDSKWDVTVMKSELQVDLSGSLGSDRY